jgi:2-oxoisovalerate dehydrogenase E1 component alpha subunit
VVTQLVPGDEPLQVIREDGTAHERFEPKLSEKEHKRLLRAMMLVRATDTKSMNLQRSGRIGFYVPSFGQEACQVGSSAAMASEDWVVPAYREPGAALLRGFPVKALIAQAYGNASDPQKGRQMPNHYGYEPIHFVTPSSPVGTQITYAAGIAWAMKLRGDKLATLVYFGDGATSQGDFHVGMNFAGVFKAPCIFFCNNNGWAISVPREMQTASKTIAVKAVAYGMEGVRVDGNDVLAVLAVTRNAVEKAKAGGGPTLIEALTYRMGPHSSSDDPTRYRSAAELEAWKKRDPIDRYQRYLLKTGVVDEDDLKEYEAEVAKEVEDAIAAVERASALDPSTLFDDVYRELTPQLKQQREELMGERKGGPAVHYEQEEGKFPL